MNNTRQAYHDKKVTTAVLESHYRCRIIFTRVNEHDTESMYERLPFKVELRSLFSVPLLFEPHEKISLLNDCKVCLGSTNESIMKVKES